MYGRDRSGGRRRPGTSGQGAALLAFTLALLATAPATALATTDTIFAAPSSAGTADCSSAANACTLATALTDAGAATGADVTIDLASGQYSSGSAITINGGTEHSLTLEGAGLTATSLFGGLSHQVLSLDDATFPITLESLEISEGSVAGNGGDLEIVTGTVTLTNVWINDGNATHGGGINVDGGTVTINDGNFTGSNATSDGGALMIFAGTVMVTGSTFSANGATSDGSAIHDQGTLHIDDSTIVGNLDSEALGVAGSGAAIIHGTTIAGNAVGGFLVNSPAAIEIGASVLANNGTNADCAVMPGSSLTDDGYNYSDDTSCAWAELTSHSDETSLDLGTPGANGGATNTIPITGASQAYDVVPTSVTLFGASHPFCSGNDQRGVPRTQGPASACSAGAFQYAPPVVTSVSPRSALELGLAITLSGYSLGNVTSATFGGAPATITSQSAGSVSLNVPASLSLGSQPITLTNTDGTATVPFSAVASPSIATLILTPGALQVPYSQSIPIAGGAGPYTYALQSGALPGGLSLSSSGVISGTPTKAGGSAFAVQVTDANGVGSTTVNLSLVIATPVVNIVSTRVTVAAGAMAVSLACVAAPCTGTASLTASVTVKLKHHRLKLESVALAAARYSLTAGQTGTVELVLTPLGEHDLSRHVLRKAKKHPLSETLNATVRGGTNATTTVSVT